MVMVEKLHEQAIRNERYNAVGLVIRELEPPIHTSTTINPSRN
jgi:hypothetical protein